MEFSSISPTIEAVEAMLPFKITKIALYAIMLFLGVVGNGMVIRTVSKTARAANIPSYLLIFNLAVCDLATPMTSIPFDLALEENNYTWPFGRVLCKVLWPIATFSATSASLTLAAISFDRYRFIMHPYAPKLTKKQVKTMIICLHAFSFLLVAPYAFYLNLEGTSCKETWPTFEYPKIYTLLLFLVQYGFPLPFMFAMYSLALKKLLLSTRRVRNSRLTEEKEISERDSKRAPSNQSCVTAQREQNVRVTKMFISVVLIFTVCMLPNQIFWLWTDFGSGHGSETSKMAGIICRMFTYANSVFNPVIYAIFSQEFQAGFRRQISSISRLFTCLKPSKLGVGTTEIKMPNSTADETSMAPGTESTKSCLPNSPNRKTHVVIHQNMHKETGQQTNQDICDTTSFGANVDVALKRHEGTSNTDLEEVKEEIYGQTNSFSDVKDQLVSSIGANGLVMIAPLDESILVSIRTLHETDC